MANSWGIIISQPPDGTIVCTPDVAGAHDRQPLGANVGDLVTWNNRTNHEIVLQAVAPSGQTFPFTSIPAGTVSNPIFIVPKVSVGYHAVIKQQASHDTSRSKSAPVPPVYWIIVVP